MKPNRTALFVAIVAVVMIALVIRTSPAQLTGAFVVAKLGPGQTDAGQTQSLTAALDGTISASSSAGASKSMVVNNTGTASYTGVALAGHQMYAANQGVSGHPGSIDVFDNRYQPVTAPGGFVDPNLPADFTPSNITALDGNLFVSYSKGQEAVGQVDEFHPNGNLIMAFTSDTLAAPSGMAIAPSQFGAFANDLLVQII